MRILAVAFLYLYPPNDGGKQGIYYRWKKISENHELHVMMLNSANEEVDDNAFEWAVNSIVFKQVVKPNNALGKKEKITQFIAWTMSEFPRQFLICNDDKVRNFINRYIDEKNIDAILVESPYSAGMLDLEYIKEKNVKIVTVFHNVENDYFKVTSRWPSVLKKIEINKIKRLERMMINISSQSICVSPDDMKEYRKMVGVDNIYYLPSYLPMPKNLWNTQNLNDNSYIIYFSKLGFQPNYEGLLYFLENIFMHYITSFPNIRLVITGKVDLELQNKITQYKNVELSGFLSKESLVDKQMNALFSVIPVYSGSGVKMKLLEALSLGIPVVTTRHCYEGVQYTERDDIPFYVAETDDEFLQKMIKLTKDDSARNKMSKHARLYFEKTYSSDENIENWLEVICN